MCTGCAMAGVTINGVQAKLKELVSDDIVIEAQ
jgi:Fe-S cluster biogenesis protein NfuA